MRSYSKKFYIVDIFFIALTFFMVSTIAAKSLPIKSPRAGTVTFARLNTEVSSEHVNSKVIATIIDGKYQGAQLIGQLITTKNQDNPHQVVHFTSLIRGKSNNAIAINAYGIDFDTARTLIITEADYDYLLRNNITLAGALTQSYANANKIMMGAGTDIGILMM